MTLEPGDLVAHRIAGRNRPAAARRRGRSRDRGRRRALQPGAGGGRVIESSQRVRALPGYPLAEIPSIKRRLIEAGVRRDRPGRRRQRHPAAGAGRRSAARSRARPRAQQVRIPAGPARLPAGGVRLYGAAVRSPLRSPDRDASPDRLEGRDRRTCRWRWPIPVTSASCPSRATRHTSAGRSWPALHAAHRPARGRRSEFLLELDDVPADVLRAHQSRVRQLSQQSDGRDRAPGLPRAHGGHLPEARDPARLRQRVLRSHLRRLRGAEHFRDSGRARRGGRVLLAVEDASR